MTWARPIAAFVVGVVAGSVVNMGLVMLGSTLVPPPAGVDVSNTQSIAESIHLFEARHFVFPFIAHAFGTFVGALVAMAVARRNEIPLATAVGCTFFVMGVAATTMIPAPTAFVVVDLLFAYIPMALLAIGVFRRTLLGTRPGPDDAK